MIGKDIDKVGAVAAGKIISPYSVVEHAHFRNSFLNAMCSQVYFLTFYYISDIQ